MLVWLPRVPRRSATALHPGLDTVRPLQGHLCSPLHRYHPINILRSPADGWHCRRGCPFPGALEAVGRFICFTCFTCGDGVKQVKQTTDPPRRGAPRKRIHLLTPGFAYPCGDAPPGGNHGPTPLGSEDRYNGVRLTYLHASCSRAVRKTPRKACISEHVGFQLRHEAERSARLPAKRASRSCLGLSVAARSRAVGMLLKHIFFI